MPQPRVHVLVINWNGLEHLEACFSSLLESSYENVEFVLLDNASTDGSVAFVDERYSSDSRVRIVPCGGNLGWSRGNNVGLRRALDERADYVLLLNNDTATAPDAIETLVDMAESDPGIGALAPKLLLFHDPEVLNSTGIEASLIGASWDRGIGRIDGPKWSTPEETLGACGAGAFLRVDALRKVGLLPEDFEIYLDDLDLCLRIWNTGYRVMSCPGARIRHKFSATTGHGAWAHRKYFLNTRNRFRMMQRNYPASRLGAILPRVALGEVRALGRAVLDGDWWKAPAHLRAWGEAGLYIPEMFRHRRREAAEDFCAYWRLIEKEMMFFPGIEFPEQGWYAPREVQGEVLRPITTRARYEHPGGPLRVVFGNGYPEQGTAEVEVRAMDEPIGAFATDSIRREQFDAPKGPLEFRGARVFDLDDTGDVIDAAGWVRIETEDNAEEPH